MGVFVLLLPLTSMCTFLRGVLFSGVIIPFVSIQFIMTTSSYIPGIPY